MLETNKTCRTCGETKSVSEFHVTDSKRPIDSLSRYRAVCGPCWNEHRKRKLDSGEWKKPTLDQIRDKEYRRHYGITADDYNAMFNYQRGCCGICGVHQNELPGRLVVDHDHSTGEVRSLLCRNCNVGLGHYGDDPELMEIAAQYLRLHGS